MPQITYREALRHALDEELTRDPNVVVMGEEVAEYDGAYKVTEGLWKKWGSKRIVDTPISEAGFIGMGVGASMLGIRPVMELMFWSFATVAWDQIINNAAQVRYMSGGLINCPIVIRGPANGGTNVGATHSHNHESFLANVPGLKVVCPSTAYDAKGLLKTAIRDNDPVMFMENTLLYGEKWEVPEEEYLIPLGKADIKREGTDITLIAHGRAALTACTAADILAAEHNINAEVIDLRSIRPLDEDAILESVRKTHRAVYIEESKPFCGVGAQISSMIMEKMLRRTRRPRAAHHEPRRPGDLFARTRKTPAPAPARRRREGAEHLLIRRPRLHAGVSALNVPVPTSRSKIGDAMSVVTTAMITSVAKSPSEMMPRCRPMLMMISSISPRAFMSVPMPSASRFEMPVARAASQQATPFPRIAATRTAPHISHRKPEFSRPIRVFRPE